jgi:hypothetical protein
MKVRAVEITLSARVSPPLRTLAFFGVAQEARRVAAKRIPRKSF